MKAAYRSAMEALYFACMVVAGIAMLVMTVIVPYSVFTRYVLNSAASWPEPGAVLMMIVFTFIGGAACYRANVHIAVRIFTDIMPGFAQRLCAWIVIVLLLSLSLFMVIWGVRLVQATWGQVMAEFTWLRVGIAYLPVPLSGAITLLFIVEQVWIGSPGEDSIMHREPVPN